MEFQSTYEEVSVAPPLYDLKLSFGGQLSLVQRLVYNTGEPNFSGLIDAVDKKEDFRCTYSAYGCLTEYAVLQGVFVINRVSNGGNCRLDFELEKYYDFVKLHVQNLQDCFLKCAELGKNLPDGLKEYIAINQEATLINSRLQLATTPIIHKLYEHLNEKKEENNDVIDISDLGDSVVEAEDVSAEKANALKLELETLKATKAAREAEEAVRIEQLERELLNTELKK